MYNCLEFVKVKKYLNCCLILRIYFIFHYYKIPYYMIIIVIKTVLYCILLYFTSAKTIISYILTLI